MNGLFKQWTGFTKCATFAFVLLQLVAGIPASATQTTYDIVFQLGSGSPAPSGAFTYDDALLANRFSALTVQWNGVALDFTALANSGANVFDTCAAGPAVLFSWLTTGQCDSTDSDDRSWNLFSTSAATSFSLGHFGSSGSVQWDLTGLGTTGEQSASGQFSTRSISAATPEPASFSLLLAASLLMLLFGPRRALISRSAKTNAAN